MFAVLSNLFRREANQPLQGSSSSTMAPSPAPPSGDPVAVICVFLGDFLAMKGVGPASRLAETYAFDSFAVQDVLSFLEIRFGKVVEPSLLTMADFETPRTIAALLEA